VSHFVVGPIRPHRERDAGGHRVRTWECCTPLRTGSERRACGVLTHADAPTWLPRHRKGSRGKPRRPPGRAPPLGPPPALWAGAPPCSCASAPAAPGSLRRADRPHPPAALTTDVAGLVSGLVDCWVAAADGSMYTHIAVSRRFGRCRRRILLCTARVRTTSNQLLSGRRRRPPPGTGRGAWMLRSSAREGQAHL